MDEFKITPEKLKMIATKFNVDFKHVETLYKGYRGLQEKTTTQFLAHVIRTLETYIRENQTEPVFTIECKAVQPCSRVNLTIASGLYVANEKYTIFYPSTMDEKQLRVCIAHELGHLFLVILEKFKGTSNTEPLSSIFGIFTIFDKNDFYENKVSPTQYEKWAEIVEDFVLLTNIRGQLEASD